MRHSSSRLSLLSQHAPHTCPCAGQALSLSYTRPLSAQWRLNAQISCCMQAAQFQAGRCYHAAHAHLSNGNPQAAHALFARVTQRADSAVAQHQDCADVDEAAVQYLEALKRTAQAWRCMAQVSNQQQPLDKCSSFCTGIDDRKGGAPCARDSFQCGWIGWGFLARHQSRLRAALAALRSSSAAAGWLPMLCCLCF